MSATTLERPPEGLNKAELWASVKKQRSEGQFVATIPTLERLCAAFPEELRFLVCLAEALIEAGRTQEGRAWLDKALKLDPEYAHAAELRRRVDAPAMAVVKTEAGAPPAFPPEAEARRAALRQEIEALSVSGRPEAAISTYHRAVSETPELVADIETWAPLVNAAGQAIYAANDERPAPWAQAAIREVYDRGIAIRSFEEVFGDEALLAELQAVVRSTSDWTVPGKPHFFKAIKEDQAPGGHPIVRAALNEKVLEVANGFYGLYSRLVSANIVQTRTDGSDGRLRKSSEGWHRDPEDTPMFKAFIYLNDVLEVGHGPFQYVPSSRRGGKYEHLLTRFGRGVYDRSYKTRPDWGKVDTEVAPEDIVTVLGKAGTLFFCNTSGFHRGGFCTTQDRYMCANVYQRPGSQFPSYVKTDLDPTGAPVAVRMAMVQP
jgi:hypothetical protein